METTTFVTKRRNKITSWEIAVTVKRRPTSLSEMRIRRDRWFHYAVDHITECFMVDVTLTSEGQSTTETFFEFVTPYGRGCVVNYAHGGEVNAFIPNTGKALLHGYWRKHNRWVGHVDAYAMAMKVDANSRSKVDHTCPARIYAALAGKKLGV